MTDRADGYEVDGHLLDNPQNAYIMTQLERVERDMVDVIQSIGALRESLVDLLKTLPVRPYEPMPMAPGQGIPRKKKTIEG